jgi:hypothetical protein
MGEGGAKSMIHSPEGNLSVSQGSSRTQYIFINVLRDVSTVVGRTEHWKDQGFTLLQLQGLGQGWRTPDTGAKSGADWDIWWHLTSEATLSKKIHQFIFLRQVRPTLLLILMYPLRIMKSTATGGRIATINYGAVVICLITNTFNRERQRHILKAAAQWHGCLSSSS